MRLRRLLWLAWAACLPLYWLAAHYLFELLGHRPADSRGAVIVLAGFIAIAMGLVFHHIKEQRIRRSGIRQVDAMNGAQFEAWLAALFTRSGYKVEGTGGGADYGADLLISRDSAVIVVQAKRYHGAVGVSAVQQAAAARSYYEAQGAMVITNSRFTRQAHALAQSNGVQLWDRGVLFDVAMGRKTISR